MRMRKLANGQSVMFCGPPEVHRKIMEHVGKLDYRAIDVSDVLLWSISNTQNNTRKCIPLWAQQGIRHQRRSVVWNDAVDSKKSLPDAAELVLEPEARSISNRYEALTVRSGITIFHGVSDEILQSRGNEMKSIQAKCEAFNVESLEGSTLQEEQERELSPEAEEERQVERPPPFKPATHYLHQDLVRMVERGSLDCSSSAFTPAFKTLRKTSASRRLDLTSWPNDLLVTVDFEQTIQCPYGQDQDDFLRPVQWILRCTVTSTLAVISPYEANELIPSILKQNGIVLHVYSPRISASSLPLDHLNFCPVPSMHIKTYSDATTAQIRHLNLFSGQLCLQDYQEYIAICRFLGLCFRIPGDKFKILSDGFLIPADRERFDEAMARECPFSTSPVEMLRALLGFRRKAQGFEKSHFGFILDGELITEDTFRIPAHGEGPN